MQTDIHGKFIPGVTRIKYGGAFIAEEERKAIDAVLDRNWWTLDEEGRLLEKELAQQAGVQHSILTNSGSSALLVAMSALNLPKGTEIIIPVLNFPTAVSAALYNNYKPVFVDVDLDTYCIDENKIKEAISNKTKIILVVNIAGLLPDIDKITALAQEYGLIIIGDNCDSFGGMWKSKFVENYYHISATSFHAAHILAMGEGGAVFTNNSDLAKRSTSLREWGRVGDSDKNFYAPDLPEDYPSRYTYITKGFNVKPLELQAAMGRVQLKKLNMIKSARRKNFDLLFEKLSDMKDCISLPKVHIHSDISCFSFPFTIKESGKRGDLMKFLEKRNIETRVIFAGNITRQPAYQNIDARYIKPFINADKIMNDAIFVSVHPSITEEMINYVAESIREFFNR